MSNATLSAAAFRAAWDHLDLGAMPIVLHVQREFAQQEPAQREPAPWSELSALGLARGSELDPWLGAIFKLVASPPRSADLRLGLGSSAVRALAASAGTGSVLAVLTGELVTVRELDHADLAGALVGLLPVLPDGRVGAPDLPGRFGAAALDAAGRRRRAEDVVDFRGPTDAVLLRKRVGELVESLFDESLFDHNIPEPARGDSP